jgi:non-ribosomal peptide synthetase component F
MVAHAGLCNLAFAQLEAFAVTPASRVLQFASYSFDACIFEVLMALCSGATLHVPAPGVLVGRALHDVLRDGHITHATLPLAALPDEALSELQTLVMAGEAASHALVQRWATGRRLINAYGPTETTVWASMHRCDTQHPGSPPIGSPIANTRIYILDVHGQPVPVGVAGEIHIAGIPVTCAVPSSLPSASCPIRSANPARACTRPATWGAGGPTAPSCSSGAPTTR